MTTKTAKMVSVTLETPIERGDETITTVQLRKPASGELRGLSIADISTLETNALITLLPRITVPPLTEPELEALDVADMMQFCTELADFLAPARYKTENPVR